MDKREYRETYGLADACECQGCGEYIHRDELKTAREPHGEYTPVCPICGSDDIRYLDEVDMKEGIDDETDM